MLKEDDSEFGDSVTYYDVFRAPTEAADWNVLVRGDGSVSVYATQDALPVHAVAIDSCPPVIWADGTAEMLEARFLLMREVAGIALRAIEETKRKNERSFCV